MIWDAVVVETLQLNSEGRMNSHKHARLTPKGRALLVSRVLEEGWTMAAAAQAAGVSRRSGYKWLARFRSEGAAGLLDRSSRPRRSPRACSAQELEQFEQRRRQRVPLWRIARESKRGLATLSRHMRRLGLSRLRSLEPPEPVLRYERAAPGELLHIDTKKLGRIQGVGHRITGDRTKTIVTAVTGTGDRLVSGASIGDEWVVTDGRATVRRIIRYRTPASRTIPMTSRIIEYQR